MRVGGEDRGGVDTKRGSFRTSPTSARPVLQRLVMGGACSGLAEVGDVLKSRSCRGW